MKGDFSKLTFDRKKHFSGVRMQQGRVQLDADWNEQMDILDSRQETDIRNLVGSSGAPSNSAGFEVTVTGSDTINISAGQYYVDGILCEMEADALFTNQPDYPEAPLNPPSIDTFYLAYLDVWKRHITYIDDPDIREKALKNIDTCTRLKTIAQVKLRQVGATDLSSPYGEFTAWNTLLASSSSVLLTPVLGTDLNFQNHLYRIEIHSVNGMDQPTTFKWSRDNATYVAAIQSISGTTITLNPEVPFLATSFTVGQKIEVSKEDLELKGQAGQLGVIETIEGNTLTVSWRGTPPDLTGYKLLRSWDGYYPTLEAEPPTTPVPTNTDIDIENGLAVKFSSGTTKVGDYWLIPTRANSNNIEWPLLPPVPPATIGDPSPQLPHGIKHHYARLALLKYTVSGTDHWSRIGDARTLFAPLNNRLSLTINAGSMYGAITNGAALVQLEHPTHKNNFRAYAFDASTDEHVHFRMPLPNIANKYAIYFKALWQQAQNDAGGILLGIAAITRESGDTEEQSFPSFSSPLSPLATLIVQQGGAEDTLYISDESVQPIIISGSNKEIEFRITRLTPDTLSCDVYLIAVQLFITPLL